METAEQVAEQPAQGSASFEDRIAAQLYGGEQPKEEKEDEQPALEADEQTEDTEGERTPTAAELVEVEFSGKQYKLPPELKDALMAQSDYTRKTQEVAERQRLVDLQALQQQEEATFQQHVRVEQNTLAQLDYEISRYKGVDWSSLDTDTYIRTKSVLDSLKEQKTDVEKQIEGKRQHFAHGMQQLFSEAREKGNQYLSRVIPKWGAETQKDLSSYGTNEGYSDVELGSLSDARMIKTLWKAMQWDRLQSQKATTTKRADQAPPVLKPGASNQNAQKANADQAYRKALRSAKTSSEKSLIIQKRLEQKLG